ncbi:MAG TPA: alpha,alpha-trehalase TreA [Acetobacteraceae bacterium]
MKNRRSHRMLVAIFLALVPASGAQAQTVPPSVEYGPLYRDVQLRGIFPDSKTFPDLIPHATPQDVVRNYAAARQAPDFDLARFVSTYFSGPVPPGPAVNPAGEGQTLATYVVSLWPVLTESYISVPPYATLLPLPYPYVVPGGRFREVYYWDSYFTMLGLEQSGKHALAVDMLKDFAFEIDRYGHIPNGNRSYYLSRSQPPFFALMVELIARHDGVATYAAYLPELQAEYDWWMQGSEVVRPGQANRHVVELADGTVLNRYWDERPAPRDESYKEDVETAATSNRPRVVVWRNLRAAAESGWDFSSRWLTDGRTLATVRTLDLLPPDLNSLLAQLERTLARAYSLKGDAENSTVYAARAHVRTHAIQRLMWDAQDGVFTDYLWREGTTTRAVTAAAIVPLFLKLATPAQAQAVAGTVSRKLLASGGLATSLIESGQQWDAPNGWAPLQWMAVVGLRNYGFDALAETIATRWVGENIAGYEKEAKLVEKYNVFTTGGEEGGGGEYATQIGFGWTTGVLLALGDLYPTLQQEIEHTVPATQALVH